MTKRPLSVTIIGWLFIVAGAVGLVYHGTEFKIGGPVRYELALVCLIRLLAIVCGIFMLRGRDWARWGLLVWIAYHVVLSAFHSLSQFLMHGLLLAVVAWFLLRPRASAYFGGGRTAQTQRRHHRPNDELLSQSQKDFTAVHPEEDQPEHEQGGRAFKHRGVD